MIRTGKIGWIVFVFFSFFSLTTEVYADISISATLEKNEIYIDDTVQLTIKINGSVGSLPDPEISSLDADFEILGSSTSTSISIINGSFQAEKDVVLQLKPLHSGVISIKNIYVESHGRRYYITPLTLKVISTYQLPATAPSATTSSSSLTSLPLPESVANFGIGVVGEVNKNKVYVGQQVIYRFLFINSRSLFGNPRYIPPTFKNVWKYDLLKQPIVKKIRRYGKWFQTQELRTAIIPLQPGEIVVPPAKISVPFGFFTGSKIFRTKPVEIKAYPLPQTGQPPCFTGAVGDGYKVKLNKREISAKVNDPLQIQVEITGPGNLSLTAPPPLTAPSSFKIFNPQVNDAVVPTPDGVIIDRIITYIFQGNKAGDFILGPLKFCYFSPQKKKYMVINTGTLKIILTGEKKVITSKTARPVLRPPSSTYEIIEYPGWITAYLMGFWKVKWLSFVIIGGFFVLFYLIRLLSFRVKMTEEMRKKRREVTASEKKLREAVKKGDPEKIYEWWKRYFRVRWNMNVDVMDPEELKSSESKTLPPDTAEIVSRITSLLHKAIFAGGAISDEIKNEVILFLRRSGKWEGE